MNRAVNPAAVASSGKPVKAKRGKKPAGKRSKPAGARRTCLLVLGMHRAGTSALTRALSLMGATLPVQLIGANKTNEAGHWEPERLVRYHDQLLAELGSAWHDWRGLDLTQLSPTRRREVRSDIAEILTANYFDAPLFVLKDPRVCRFAPLYADILSEIDVRLVPVLPFRNPLEVMTSLEQRSKVWPPDHSRADAALLWLRHVLDAEFATRGMDRAIISYDTLAKDWRSALGQIVALDIAFPHTIDDAAPDIDTFIRPELRHHLRRDEEVALDPLLGGWIDEAHSAMRLLARKPESKKACARLDQVRNAFDKAAPVLNCLVSASREKAASARNESGKHEEVVAATHARIEALTADRHRLQTERDEAVKEAGGLRERLDEINAKLVRLDQEVDQQAEQRAVLEETLEEERSRRTEIEDQVVTHRERADRVGEELAAAQAEISGLHEASEQQGKEIKAARDVLASGQGDNRDLVALVETQQAKSNHDAAALREALARVERSAQATQDALHAELAAVAESAARSADVHAQERDQLVRQTEVAERTSSEAVDNAARAADDAGKREADLLARLAEAEERELEGRSHAERARTLKSQVTKRDARIAKLKQEKADRDRRIVSLKQEREHYASALTAARAKVTEVTDKYRNSTSWKLTAPFRAIKAGPRTLFRVFRATPAAVRMGGGLAPTAKKAVVAYRKEGSAGVSSRIALVSGSKDAPTAKKPVDPPPDAPPTWSDDPNASTFGLSRPYDFKSAGALNEIAREYVQNKRSATHTFYTSIAGDYDDVKYHEHLDLQADYVLFRDEPEETYVFEVRRNPYFDINAVRRARYVKTHPHYLIDGVPVAIWVDGNVMIRGDVSDQISEFLRSELPIAAFPHPQRRSVYEEAEECIKRKKDAKETINAQMERYRRVGFDCDDLIESNFMMFRLDHPVLPDIMNGWWKEIERGSHRDQLSFNYAMAGAGAHYFPLSERPNSVRNHPALTLFGHGGEQRGSSVPEPALRLDRPRSYAEVKRERIARHKDVPADIVVCVHNALDEVQACLKSVNENRRPDTHRIIVVDDGSGDETKDWLAQFERSNDNVTLTRHERARGYTRSANAGLRASTGDFVVLLNSDTVVSADWLDKLIDAAFSTPGVGIVGPLSNAASSQSIPDHRSRDGQTAINEMPQGMTIVDVNNWCEDNAGADFLPLVPFVHGFCFGLTRQVIDKVGYMDEEHFPFGYGEENDYCLRAAGEGFQLAVAVHTYVFHEKSKSYSDPERRKNLTRNGNNKIRELHGESRVARSIKSLQSNSYLDGLRARSSVFFEGKAGDGAR